MEAFSRGCSLAKRAIDADLQGEYSTAYPLYINSIKCLMSAVKTMGDENIRLRLIARIEGYVARAEVLKRYLGGEKEPPPPPTPSDITLPPVIEVVGWGDIVGLEAAKLALQRAVILPTKFPGVFPPPSGAILLYGPPGTGKTLLAKAVASVQGGSFFSFSVADIVSKYLGEAESNLREVFERARRAKPSVVFIDEVEVLCGKREESHEAMARVTAEFLSQLDGVGKTMEGVVLIGATNSPWSIDSAMRRRFTKRIYIPLPGRDAREEFLRKNKELTGVTVDDLERFSGADMAYLLAEVRFEPLRRYQEQLFTEGEDGFYSPSDLGVPLLEVPPGKLRPPPPPSPQDARAVLERVHPATSSEELQRFELWTSQYGERGGGQ